MDVEGEVWREHTRLAILIALDKVPGQTATPSMLLTILRRVGIRINEPQLKGEVDWLKKAALVAVVVDRGLTSIEMLHTGRDVARGQDTYPGVAEPTRR